MQNNGSVRRVTGSADIPITADGKKQAVQMKDRIAEPFDHVFCGPEDRSIETAKYFGDPIILKGLDAWYRGESEGRTADSVKATMRSLILHPNVRPSGKSPISGKAGETYDEFLDPLMHAMRLIEEHEKPEERILIVTSGGNLQAIDQLASKGFPAKRDPQEYRELAKQPYWSATGQLFKVGKHLEEVENNRAVGNYAIEHFATAFNPADAQDIPKRATEEREYSSTQMNMPDDVSKAVRDFAGKIPKEHLTEDGVEDRPHVTVLYGLHSEQPDESQRALNGHGPVTVRLKHASIFPSEKHDVLKMDVHSPELHKLNAHLKDNVQHTETFPDYHPHVTVAYLKKGEGKKYVGRVVPGATWKKLTLDHVLFSPKSGEKTKITLAK